MSTIPAPTLDTSGRITDSQPGTIGQGKHTDGRLGVRPRPPPPKLSSPSYNDPTPRPYPRSNPVSPRQAPLSPGPLYHGNLSPHPATGLRSPSLSSAVSSSGPPSPVSLRAASSPLSPHPHPLRKKASQGLRPRASPTIPSPLSDSGVPGSDQPSPTFSTSSSGFRRPSNASIRTESSRATYLSSHFVPGHETPDVASMNLYGDAGSRQRGLTVSSAKRNPPGPGHLARTTTGLADTVTTRGTLNSHSPCVGNGSNAPDSYRLSLGREPKPPTFGDDGRSSSRSGWTNASSSLLDTSGTERSSIVTKASSISDYETAEADSVTLEEATAEEIIAMYYYDMNDLDNSDEGYISQSRGAAAIPPVPPLPSLPPKSAPPTVTAESEPMRPPSLFPKPAYAIPPSERSSGFQSIRSAATGESLLGPFPRDRYGFKKTNSYITEKEFDAWNAQYSEYLDRRRSKWHQVMRQFGLPVEKPTRFPCKSDTMKKYVRKGIPPEFRGAAWFWYAGGPEILARNEGVYAKYLKAVEEGELAELDREAIERDVHRTFPDNIKFKPERERPMSGGSTTTASVAEQIVEAESEREETSIIKALRRVLQAFAVRNQHIGYCQSLNFLAGMLLLFLDEDEEKAFTLLNVTTNLHLPGNHNRELGADVDIAVLMSYVRETMPAVWAKIDDHGWREVPDRLPTISLTTTSWFMACFVGALPTETVLRIWDCFFYEGSKTLFRIALAVFKLGEPPLRAVHEPVEVLQVLQSVPRRLLDANALMEVCFRRRHGFGGISQDTIEARRAQKRRLFQASRGAAPASPVSAGGGAVKSDGASELERVMTAPAVRAPSRHRFMRMQSRKKIRPDAEEA